MSSISWWNRIEPDARAESLEEPLQARIRDPLWMLTRQWQFGEFRGADAGSPAFVELRARIGRMTAWQTEGQKPTPRSAAPLERDAEREPLSPDLMTSVELGQMFESILAAHGLTSLIAAFRAAYLVALTATDPADPAEVTLRRVFAGRAFDGAALHAKARTAWPSLPSAPSIPSQQSTAAQAAVGEFLQRVADTFGPIGLGDAPTWRSDRLEYRMDVALTNADGGGATLAATPGGDGMLDWAAFDLREAGGAGSGQVETVERNLMPTHVRFRGMPNARFWDFEHGAADLGAIRPDKRDLARMAIVDFALVHTNDWFIIPVAQPIGSALQIDLLLVHDTFGVLTRVERADREPGSQGRWSMFATALAGVRGATADFFLLPPSAGAALQTGPVVEQVRFTRDEMANMVWAIERLTENAAGEPWPGHERDVARRGRAPAPPPPPSMEAPLRYQIQNRVAEHWIPFLPVDPARGLVALQRGAMLTADGKTEVQPAGRVLRPERPAGASYRIAEEEVPRTGVRVERVVCRSRWFDGSTHLWVQRRRTAGAGESNSALRFDLALPTE